MILGDLRLGVSRRLRTLPDTPRYLWESTDIISDRFSGVADTGYWFSWLSRSWKFDRATNGRTMENNANQWKPMKTNENFRVFEIFLKFRFTKIKITQSSVGRFRKIYMFWIEKVRGFPMHSFLLKTDVKKSKNMIQIDLFFFTQKETTTDPILRSLFKGLIPNVIAGFDIKSMF